MAKTSRLRRVRGHTNAGHTLGVRGGGMHTPNEYMIIDSLTERARLNALLLLRLARGEIDWPTRPRTTNATA